MHMTDALLSPAIGDVVWSKTAALTAYNARQVQTRLDNRKIPSMGILGAFCSVSDHVGHKKAVNKETLRERI